MTRIVSCTHKPAHRKESVMHVWGNSSPLMALHTVLNQKRTSTVVEHSFDMNKVHVHLVVIELCRGGKRKERKKKR